MSSQLLLEFRHKKGYFSVANGSGLCFHGLINDLDPGLQPTVVFGKPLGYLPDGNTQPYILWYLKPFENPAAMLKVPEGMTPSTVVSCASNTIWIA